MDKEEDLDGHDYVLSPTCVYDYAGFSGQKITLGTSNSGDLRECVALLEKIILDIASFVRDKRLRRIENNKKKQQDQGKLVYFLYILFNLPA